MEIALPKFKIALGTFSVKQALKSLGTNTPFGGSADFSGITKSGRLFISDVMQKAFIGVNESGTAY